MGENSKIQESWIKGFEIHKNAIFLYTALYWDKNYQNLGIWNNPENFSPLFFLATFAKRNNFCDFLFASLDNWWPLGQ